MLKRIRKPISTKETMNTIFLLNRMKKFFALLGILGMIWGYIPWNVIDAATTKENDIETISEEPFEENNYPTTTDPDFDQSLVEIEGEVIEERTATSKTFRKIDGTYEVAVYDEVIHYYKNGKWLDIDNRLHDLGDELETTANSFKLTFPKTLSDNKDIKMTIDDYKINWSINDIDKSSISYDNEEIKAKNIKELVNVIDSVQYNDIFDGVDIEYVMTGNKVKENIVLNQYIENFNITFEYKLSDLELVQDEEGNINFVNSNNEILFVFDDLIMFDNNLDESWDLDLQLVQTGNKTYNITLTPNDEWLQNATYPVQIDPSIIYYHYQGLIRDKYVYSNSYGDFSADNQYVKVGNNNSYKYRSYIELDLSILPDDAQITYGHLMMQTYSNYNNCTYDCNVIVKEVLPQYSFDSIKGQELNITDDRIIDYEIVNSEDSDSTNYYWDISRNLQEWIFSGDTERVLEFRRENESQYGYIYFQSSNQAGIGPSVEIGYQYISGVKDFWTYSEQPVGVAGTGFVSDYTGLLNFVREDVSYATELQEFGLSFVYNLYDTDLDIGYGQGWLTNYNIEAHYDTTASQYYTIDATGGKVWYLMYEGDAYESCDERFSEWNDVVCYLAEDGSRNMLAVRYYDRGNGPEPYETYLVTLEQVWYEFSASGYLESIKDEKHKTEITLDYTWVWFGSKNYARIEKITDNVGNYIDLTYIDGNSDGDYRDLVDYLDKAKLYVKTSSSNTYNFLRYTEYEFDTTTYQGERQLEEVIHLVDYDNNESFTVDSKAVYSYDSLNRMLSAETRFEDSSHQDVYAGKVEYTYNGIKVNTITNSYNNSDFGSVTYDYEYRKTTITNHLDEEVYYLFDVYGHTVQVMTDEGLLQSYKYLNIFTNTNYDYTYEPYYYYLRNYRLNHQLIYKSDPEISFLDPVQNGSFESSASTDEWDFIVDDLGGASAAWDAAYTYTGNEFVFGDRSVQLYYPIDDSMESHLEQTITVDSGTYKLQGYVKNHGSSSNAYFRIEGATYAGGNSSTVVNDGEWHYIELTFGATVSNQQITIKLMNAAHGTVYFDGLQVVEGYRNSRSNLFENSSFESTLSGWTLDGAYQYAYSLSTEDIYSDILGNTGIRINGDAYDVSSAGYDITSITGTAEGDFYTVNLWGYSMGTPYKQHSDDGNSSTYDQASYFRARVSYLDSSDNEVADSAYITFDQQIEGWQKLSTEVHIPAGTSSVIITLEYIGLGYVIFDGLTIEQSISGTNYMVNNAGNIERIVTSNSEVTTLNHEEDSNGNPVSSTPSNINTLLNNTVIPLNEDFLPEYYENNNVRVTPTYDSNGRTTVETYGDAANYFSTSTTYDTGTLGQFKESTTNEFGKSTSYDYDVVTGLLQSIQNANGSTTEYEYYEDGLLHKVMNNDYCDDSNPTDCALTEYVYDDYNRLIKIIMETGYYYQIDYDSEGRMEEVFVANDSTSYMTTLMSYVYDTDGTSGEYDTNRIDTQTYGNGDFIKFIYDENDRVESVQYNNSVGSPETRFSYEYDQRGQIAVFNTHDSSGIIETEYYTYDISGNLVAVSDNDGNRIEYVYDDSGNVIELKFDILGRTQTVEYDNQEPLSINRDILDEQIFGNYNISSGTIYQSDSDHEYELGTTTMSINTGGSEPSFGGPIEVMPSSSYTASMNVQSTSYNIRLQVEQYSADPFESGNYISTFYDSYSTSTGLRDLTFTTASNAQFVIVSVYSGSTADFVFDSMELDFNGLDNTSLYDKTNYTTQDLQNVIKDYEYEDNALFRLDFINLQNGTFSIDQDYIYSGNTTRINEIEYRIDADDNGIVDDILKFVYSYDDLGNIHEVSYYEDSTIITYERYEYDEMNQLHVVDSWFDSSLQVSSYTRYYYYDFRGNITDIKTYEYEQDDDDLIAHQTTIPATNPYSPNITNYGYYNLITMDTISGNLHNELFELDLYESFNYNFVYFDIDNMFEPYTINTQLIYTNLNTSQEGYYYATFNGSDTPYYDVDFTIVIKVGNPVTTQTTYSLVVPQEHIKYNYSTDWLDQLENYETITYNTDGSINTQVTEQTYTYDDQGNPTTITNFLYNDTEYDHADLEYDGRQLSAVKIYNSSETLIDTISYTYNDQGYRTSKTVDGVKTNYHLDNGKVLVESDGTYAIIYTYDYDGRLISFNYNDYYSNTYDGEYFYIRNQQGDITNIVDVDGSIVVEYKYDAWGNILEISGSLANTIGVINPYRYRGYRYDEEISMYYLNSRFYDGNIGRFINADGLLGSQGDILGHNMYAYTQNNPVMYSDISGYFVVATLAIIFAVGAISGVIGQIISDSIESRITGQPSEFSWHKYLGAALGGGLGMVIGYATGWNPVVAGAATGGLTSYFQDQFCNMSGDCDYSDEEINQHAFFATAAGGLSGVILGGFGKAPGINAGANSWQAIFKSGVSKSMRYGFSMSAKTIGKGVASNLYEGLVLDIYFGINQSDIIEENVYLQFD